MFALKISIQLQRKAEMYNLYIYNSCCIDDMQSCIYAIFELEMYEMIKVVKYKMTHMPSRF